MRGFVPGRSSIHAVASIFKGLTGRPRRGPGCEGVVQERERAEGSMVGEAARLERTHHVGLALALVQMVLA